MSEINMRNCHLYLEDMGFDERPKQHKKNPRNRACNECDVDHIKTDDGFPLCPLCGLVNRDEPEFVNEMVDNDIKRKTMSIYKRRLYVKEKLNLLVGNKQSRSKMYKDILTKLSHKKIKNIIHLKRMLKKGDDKRFYKYIYNIYYDLKKIRLIKMSHNDIDFLAKKFIDVETKFKEINDVRSNFFSYSSVIYLLMKKYKYAGYQHIILPLNHLQISKKIKTLL